MVKGMICNMYSEQLFPSHFLFPVEKEHFVPNEFLWADSTGSAFVPEGDESV